MIQKIGTEYGSHYIDLDRLRPGDTIIDCGVGRDISFAAGLPAATLALNFIFIDPDQSCEDFISKSMQNYRFIHGAAHSHGLSTAIYQGKPDSSSSIYPDHRAVTENHQYIKAVNIPELCNDIHAAGGRVGCLKLDVEGAEYYILNMDITADQITVEFHHGFIESIKLKQTIAIVRKLSARYTYFTADGREYLFTLKS